MEKIIFTKKDPLKEINFSKKQIFNFLNMYSLWLFRNNKLFKKSVSSEEVMNFPDGGMIQRKIKSKRVRGPAITKKILISGFARNKRHFFIGVSGDEISLLHEKTKIPMKNIGAYNPPFIQGIEFSKTEKEKIIQKVNLFRTNYLWICIGNPKQEILSNQIFDFVKADKIFNVGTALDFLLKKKKEAPLIFRKLGIEWFYRGIVDFKNSWRKILRSFIALGYLGDIELK